MCHIVQILRNIVNFLINFDFLNCNILIKGTIYSLFVLKDDYLECQSRPIAYSASAYTGVWL